MKKFFNFVSRGREVDNLAGLITLKSVVRIHPNATKNLKDGSSALFRDERAISGARGLTEFRQNNGSQDRNILALADKMLSRKAQIISGLFSFAKTLSI